MMNVPMRPLDFGEVLDGAFTLLRRNFSTFFGVAFLPQVPLVALWLLMPLFFGASDPDTVVGAVSLLMTPYSLFVMVLTMGALTYAAGAAYAGEVPGIGGSLKRGLARLVPVAVTTIIVWLLAVLGLILVVVPGLIVMAMFFAVHPAVVLEGRGPIDALGRSRDLSRGARMRILGIVLVAWIITMLPSLAMWLVAGVSVGMAAVPDMLVGGGWGLAVTQAAGITISAVTWPFLMIVTVLLYSDRRARAEATDLETAADTLLGSGA